MESRGKRRSIEMDNNCGRSVRVYRVSLLLARIRYVNHLEGKARLCVGVACPVGGGLGVPLLVTLPTSSKPFRLTERNFNRRFFGHGVDN